MAGHDENRLTSEDRALIVGRMREVLAKFGVRDYRPTWADVPTFERLGWHAIGCDDRDLRQSELDEIRATACEVLGVSATTEEGGE